MHEDDDDDSGRAGRNRSGRSWRRDSTGERGLRRGARLARRRRAPKSIATTSLAARRGRRSRCDQLQSPRTANLVVVATPWDSAVATVSALRSALAGKIVISMVNALVREGKRVMPLYPSARLHGRADSPSRCPRATIVGAFHHLPAAQMEDLDSDLDADVVIFSDDADARERVAEMVDEMPGLRAVIAGSMSLASAVEAFTAVCISINIRHKAHSYVKLAGLKN